MVNIIVKYVLLSTESRCIIVFYIVVRFLNFSQATGSIKDWC